MNASIVHDNIFLALGITLQRSVDAITKLLKNLDGHRPYPGLISEKANAAADFHDCRVPKMRDDIPELTHKHTPRQASPDSAQGKIITHLIVRQLESIPNNRLGGLGAG